jgi:hypothetical protein
MRRHVARVRQASDRQGLEQRLRELIVFVAADPPVRAILKKFRAGARDIRELYGFLMESAYRVPHGHDAVLCSITNPIVIFAYLRDRHRSDDRRFALGFADACLRHFDGGHTDRFLLGLLAVPENFVPAFP